MESCHVKEAHPEFAIGQLQSTECWDYRHVPPYLAYWYLLFQKHSHYRSSLGCKESNHSSCSQSLLPLQVWLEIQRGLIKTQKCSGDVACLLFRASLLRFGNTDTWTG